MTGSPVQSPRQPDAFEELRAARGEGWQWQRIQSEPCPQCGDHPGARDPRSLGELTVERVATWRAFLESADDSAVRHIPEPGVFSPLQYAAHVRDIVQVYTDRIVLGLEQDGPTVPIHMPPQEAWDEYNRSPVEQIAGDMAAQAARLRDVIAAMPPDAWTRTVVNDRGVYGVVTWTLAGLACNAAHEAHHHLLDATGALAAP